MNIIKYLWDNTELDKKEFARNKKIIISSMVYTIIIMFAFAGLCLIFPNDVHNMDAVGVLGFFILISCVVAITRDVFWYTKFKIKICSVLIVLIISAFLAYRKDGYFINMTTFGSNAFIIFLVLTGIKRTIQYATAIVRFLTRKSK